jgi:hypothetical protein
MINKDKIAVMFSKNNPAHVKEQIMAILGINQETQNDKYLGLPVYIRKSKKSAFAYIKQRVWAWIQRMAGEVTLKGREGDPYGSGSASHSYLCYVMF